MRRRGTLAAVIVATLMSASARAETLDWIHRLGGSNNSFDQSRGVSADGLGSVYISGLTEFGLEETDPQYRVAFIGKYDASGTLQWTQQLGTSERDDSTGVSADGLGNVYISGMTKGSLGGTNAGELDVFLAKYDASGTLQWTRQIGTSSDDKSWGGGVSADGLGSVYVLGGTAGSLGGANAGGADVFLAKYDASGTLQWTQQLGTSESDSSGRSGVSADGLGNVYISGDTSGSLGGPNAGELDVFLAKYDASGTLEWTRQIGTSSDDESGGVSADGLGNVYISGWTGGNLGGTNAGNMDAFVAKYDASGTLEWTRHIGTSERDVGRGVSADGLGSVYISGITRGSLGGPNAGGEDAFLSKYDASGTLEWTQQHGSFGSESSSAVSADGLGSVYSSGSVGLGPGSWDAFVAKFTDLLLGDVYLDGVVNGLDVDPFVEVLLSGPYQPGADMNEDQVVNGLDVDPFVAAVVGGTQPVPEPSTLILLALGVIGAWRKWGDVA